MGNARSGSLRHPSIRFRVARFLLRLILGSLFEIEADQLQRVPKEPYILVSNHLNWVDPFVLLAWLPASPRLHVLGRRSAIYNRFWKRWVLDFFGVVIPIEPGPENAGGIQEVNAALDRGASLALFPEGGVGKSEGALRPLKHGVVHFAQHSGCPVVPAGICGTHELWLRKPLRLRIGTPLRLRADTDVMSELDRLRLALEQALPVYKEPSGPRRWPWLTTLLR